MMFWRKCIYLLLFIVCNSQTAEILHPISRFQDTVTRGNLSRIRHRAKSLILQRNEHFNQYYKAIDNTYLYIHIPALQEDHEKKRTLFLYLSGFGGHHGEINNLFPNHEKIEEDAANLEIIIPCFEFTNYADQPHAYVLNTDFGQEQDLSAVLTGLKIFCLNGFSSYEKIAIVGRSRGGCVAVNLIGVLSTKDHPLLIEHDISEQDRLLLLCLIAKGGIALVTPLIDLKHATQKIFGKVFGFFVYQSASLFLPEAYKKKSLLKPLKTILQWQGDQIPVAILYATQDTIVGKKYNEEFAEKLLASNRREAIVLTIQGGHNSQEIYRITTQVVAKSLRENSEANVADIIASLYREEGREAG